MPSFYFIYLLCFILGEGRAYEYSEHYLCTFYFIVYRLWDMQYLRRRCHQFRCFKAATDNFSTTHRTPAQFINIFADDMRLLATRSLLSG